MRFGIASGEQCCSETFAEAAFPPERAGRQLGEAVNNSGFSGTVTNTSLPDIIQLICIGRNTCRMHVRSGYHKGLICFKDGEIVHAETEGVGGEEAFYSILLWELGIFECDDKLNEQETIHESWDFLLMESMRRLDNARSSN